MLVRERDGDDFDQLAGRRRGLGQPGDAAAFPTAVAQNLELNDFLSVINRLGTVKRDTRGPRGAFDVDMGRSHELPPFKALLRHINPDFS